MAIMKCKMCGGALEIVQDSTIAQCEYCGSMQTLPKVNDDRLTSFYDRANDLRISHEFDKAAEIYERIIEENPTDADAYWSMVLCRYGIDYVEETKGGPRKPTINRAQLVPVQEDVNYRSAIKYADADQKRLYEAEAAAGGPAGRLRQGDGRPLHPGGAATTLSPPGSAQSRGRAGAPTPAHRK